MSRSSLERERIIQMQKMNQQPEPQPQPAAAVPMPYYPAYGYPPMYPAYYVDPNYAYNAQYADPNYAYNAQYVDPNAAMMPEPHTDTRTDLVPHHGNKTNFNINSLLFNNITSSDYFLALDQLPTFHDVIEEVINCVDHVEPWQAGTARMPSTSFCLLVRLMQMRITEKELLSMLNCPDSGCVRALGFLYLRYATNPKDLYKRYEDYLEDEEEFTPAADKNLRMTIGEYVRKLLTDMQYFGTTLPRIPVPIERKIKVLLLLLRDKQTRRESNRALKRHFHVGAKVSAIYADEENEPAWYDAEIISVEDDRYYVTFTEYGNSEYVDLGDMKLPESKDKPKEKHRSRSRSTSRGRSRRSRSRSRDNRSESKERDSGNLLEAVLKSEREASLAVGKNYGNRPASYKGSLSLKLDRYTVRKKSRSRSRERRRSPKRDRHERRERSPSPVRRAPPVSREQEERMRKLREKYGDASFKG